MVSSFLCQFYFITIFKLFHSFAQNAERAKCKPKMNATNDDSKEVKLLRDEVKRLQNELDLTKSAIFNATFTTTSADSSDCDKNVTINLDNARKRNREEDSSDFEDLGNSPKIFIKTVKLPYDERQKLMNFEKENQELKRKLEEAQSRIIIEEKKNLKLIQKSDMLKEILFKKKLQLFSLKKKIKPDDEIDQSELVVMHKNLIISCLENQLQKLIGRHREMIEHYDENINSICDSFNEKIREKNEKISILNQAVHNHEFNNQQKTFITELQNHLQESTKFAEELNEENLQLTQINESLKKGFKASLTNTRNQFNELLESKQQQAAEFRQHIQDLKNEELRDHLKLQDHYEKLYHELTIKNENSNTKILKLQIDIKCAEETIVQLRNRYENVEKMKEDTRRHENEKIKFIKQQFQMKLIDKTNQFQKILRAKEFEQKSQSTCENIIFSSNKSAKYEVRAN